MQKIITTVGNVVSGSARAKETLEWLSSDIFGKVAQIKEGCHDRPGQDFHQSERKYGQPRTPPRKSRICRRAGSAARRHGTSSKQKTGIGGSMNVQEAEEFKTSKFFCKTDFDMKEIKKEEAAYVPLPKFYTFKSREERGTHSLPEFL